MSKDLISAMSERSKRVADIISERMDKNHVDMPFTRSDYTFFKIWAEVRSNKNGISKTKE